MSKTITTTFLLKNPAKVREMVASGMRLLVKHNGEIVMEITLPQAHGSRKRKPPQMLKSNQPNYRFNREELYNED
jgi:ABC-type uncharacterized transport system ATPase component